MSLAFGSDLRRPLPAAGDAFDETRVLGGALVGDPSASRSPWPWPVQTVLAPVLGNGWWIGCWDLLTLGSGGLGTGWT